MLQLTMRESGVVIGEWSTTIDVSDSDTMRLVILLKEIGFHDDLTEMRDEMCRDW